MRPSRFFAVILVLACLVPTASASSAEPGIRPGLPRVPVSGLPSGLDEETRNNFSWSNVAQTGLSGSPTSRQWLRVPVSIAATNIDFFTQDATDEQGVVATTAQYDIFAFLTPTSASEPYGRSADIPVRTVAFGSIPAEVTLQLRQRRTADDLPVGFRLFAEFTTDFRQAISYYPPTTLEDDVEVVVKRLRLDGRDVSLGAECSTGPTAELNLASEEITIDEGAGERFTQDRGFSGLEGGTLDGTLEIPAFSNCISPTGDDLSPILTSAISGTGNPVRITIGILGCIEEVNAEGFPLPSVPGTDPENAGCAPDLNEDVEGVPSPLPLPTVAPTPGPPPTVTRP